MTQSRRIILVFPETPVPFGNAAARWFCVLLKGLVNSGHNVTAFAACSKRSDMEEAKLLFPKPHYDLRCYNFSTETGLAAKWRTLRQPYSYPFSKQMRRDLHAEVQKGCDVLHLEQLWSGWVGLPYTERAVLNIHYLFKIDLAHRQRTSLRQRADFSFTCQAERRLLKRYSHICTLSARLSNELRSMNPAASIHTIPISLDLENYPFDPHRTLSPRPTVSLIGSFDWEPTFSAAQRLGQLWPSIRRAVPAARLQVVGRNAQLVEQFFASDPSTKVEPNVPDILPYFQKSDLLVYAPTAGSGMKVKVMEAFALGVPVVTNTDGLEGIPGVDGVHASLAETEQQLLERAVALLTTPDKWRSQRTKARQLIEQELSGQASLEKVDALHKSLAGSPSTIQ